MKSRCLLIALLALEMAGLLTACSRNGEGKDSGEKNGEPSRVQRGAHGEIVVTLDEPTQKRIGLVAETPAPSQWQPEVRAYGRVLDPAPLAALAAEFDSGRAAAEASRQEYERLKVLAEQSNASTRALQAAEANARRDQVFVESTRAKVALGWGKAVTEQNDLSAFARSLALGEAALVRLDLPAGQTLKTSPPSARLVSLADEHHPLSAEFFDAATSVDPQTQGQGFLFLARGKIFAPGTAVTGYLRVPGDPSSGVIVPQAAVLRHEGKAWVYVQTGDSGFVRREITLDRPADNGWFVSGGVTAQDRVVVSGA